MPSNRIMTGSFCSALTHRRRCTASSMTLVSSASLASSLEGRRSASPSASSSSASSCSATARTISSLVRNWWYTAAFVTPMASAIIWSDVPLTPNSANRSKAAAITRCSAALKSFGLRMEAGGVGATR